MHLPRPVVRVVSRPVNRVVMGPRLPARLRRRVGDVAALPLRPPAGVHLSHLTLGARPAEHLRPTVARRLSASGDRGVGAVLYLHGGGYVVGSPRMYRGLTGHLAAAAGCGVYAPDYRLAPEYPYPAALEDAVAAFDTIADREDVAPGRIAVAGDSAGGGLAVATACRLVATGRVPAALVLLSPWTQPFDDDLADRDHVLTRAGSHAHAAQYLRAGGDRHDAGFAPMFADLAGLPPTLVHVAPEEILAAQIRRFVVRLRDAGVDVRVEELPGLWHSVHVYAGLLRGATDAVGDVGAFLRSRGPGDVARPP